MINVFYLFVSFVMLFMIMISDINNLICILFVHLSSIIPENFKDHTLIITEILEFIELHTYKFGLVYVLYPTKEKHNTYNSSTLRKITVSSVSFHNMSVTTALHMFCNQVSNVFKKMRHNNWVSNNYCTVAYNKRFIMFS